MKFRKDFVTNSSSSSFILAFDEQKDYQHMIENCDWLGYEKFSGWIEKALSETSQDEHRKKARELLHRYFENEIFSDAILLEHFGEEYKSMNYVEISAYKSTEEYASKLEEFFSADKEYNEKLKRINEADTVVEMMIWDTNGGVLEWAIRNGFLESEFWWYLILRWNIG